MNTSTALARNITQQIISSGITDVVMSPGSRNAPLSIALYVAQTHGLINLHVRIDERSAGFFALGIAKASCKPVALLCTSGTAVANYLPAVLEAHHSQVPLLVMTADRPARLRQTGANQTTMQAGIFGQAVSLACDVSEIDFDFTDVFSTLTHGPVHLNVQFDEPLLPDDESDWLKGVTPGSYKAGKPRGQEELEITESRGLIVVGHDRGTFNCADISAFAREIGWPVIAEDPLSFPESIAHASLFLTSQVIRTQLKPETVIVIGRTTLSRSVNALIKSSGREIVIDSRISSVDVKRSADQLFAAIPHLIKSAEADSEWDKQWRNYSDATNQLFSTLPQWCEANIAREVSALIPDSASLFISSSRPIRDIEGFASSRTGLNTFANRGLAGIDGNISTALGIASQYETSFAIVGDLSFLHDMGALVSTEKINLRLLVINNDGGGIFSTLPQNSVEGFETIFGTPHGKDPAKIAQAMGVASFTVESIDELREKISAPVKGVSVVVANVPSREMNAQILRDFYQAVEKL